MRTCALTRLALAHSSSVTSGTDPSPPHPLSHPASQKPNHPSQPRPERPLTTLGYLAAPSTRLGCPEKHATPVHAPCPHHARHLGSRPARGKQNAFLML